MNLFDESIALFVNQFVRHSKLFDLIVFEIADNHLLKGGVLALAIWYLWFKPDADQKKIRIALITTLFGSFVAVLIGRVLPLTLPFRPRPIFNQDLHLTLPYYLSNGFDNLSSFPSDHAALFFSISAGVYFASKKIGRLMILYTFIFIVLPRLYLGVHYATDLLVGAFIGVLVANLANRECIKTRVSSIMFRFSEQRSEIFYPLLFLITYQISVLFFDFRNLARLGINILNILTNHPFRVS